MNTHTDNSFTSTGETDNPRAEIERIAAAFALFFQRRAARRSAAVGSLAAPGILGGWLHTRAFVRGCLAVARRGAYRATRPLSVKRALVCTVALIVFAQPNLALAGILTQPAPEQLALKRSQAIANRGSLISHDSTSRAGRLPSIAAIIAGDIPGVIAGGIAATPSRVASLAVDAFNLVFPFNEDSAPPRPRVAPSPRLTLPTSLRTESPFDPVVFSVDAVGADPSTGISRIAIRGANLDPRASVTFDGRNIAALKQAKRQTDEIIALAPVAPGSLEIADHVITVANPNGRMTTQIVRASLFTAAPSLLSSSALLLLSAPGSLFAASPLLPLSPSPSPVPQSTGSGLPDIAISRQTPTLNGGRIEGTLRVFEGATWTINAGFQLTSDLFVPGTPTIRTNGNSSYGGTVDDGGAATPSGYIITLNGNVNLPGKIHIHSNPTALPSDIPASVPAATGTRTVIINSASDAGAVGNWATVRDLTVNGANLSVDVPPGHYGAFTINGNSRLNFSGGDYSFTGGVIVNGTSSIQATGAVSITTAQNLTVNGGSFIQLGPNTLPGSVKLNALGTQLIVNGNAILTALVRAPNAQVTLNGNSEVHGQVIANKLVMNGNCRILGDLAAPAVDISSPANNSTTTADHVVVSGHASDTGVNATGIAHVFVNNLEAVYSPSAGTWALANFPLAAGPNVITARAVDAVGNQATAQITVTRQLPPQDTTPPLLAITSPANNSESQSASITVSGTVSDPGATATGIASVKVNNIDATRDVLAGTWTLAGLPLTIGANTITARAVDNAGNATTVSITVTRRELPPPDTTPPTVTITSPANNAVTFDSSITVTGTAVDSGTGATGVSRVFVNGVEATYDAGAHTWTSTGVSLSDGDNRIVAEALDNVTPTPNRGSAELHVRRRIVAPPQVSISNPLDGAVVSASSITIAGTVTSGASDISVTVKVNNQDAPVAGGQYTKTITLVDGPNQITALAADSLNQTAQSSITVVHDSRPPTVAISSSPATVQSGGSYEIRAEASDDIGVASVDFSVDGQLVTSDTLTPYGFTLAVPATMQPEQIITITATARDQAGLTVTDTVRARVTGPGGVSGYAFDDATGFGIEGVALLGAAGPIGTDHTGAFNFVSSSSAGLVKFAKTGFTPVERAFSVTPGRGVSLFDARLTSLSTTANNIGASGGIASGAGGRLQVVFPANALTNQTDIRVTSISQQGLINLLPFGWSPVPGAVVDVRDVTGSAGILPASPAHLTISQTDGLAAATPLVLARYDESSHLWVVVSIGLTAGANGALQADLTSLGQYAFLVADTGSTAPPAPVAGQPLPSSAPAESSVLDTAVTFASATANPRTALISPDARSTIAFLATASSKLPSGVAIEATFGETYNLLTDSNPLLVDRPAQDFVLYSYPAAATDDPNKLGALFIAKPTRGDFTLAQLRTANVHVEIRSGRGSSGGVLTGASGGEVNIDSGAKLEIPAGALTGSTPVFIENVPVDLTGLSLPAGYEIVGAIDVDVSSTTLASSATLSIPSVAGDLSRIVVARLITAAGRRSPKVVARAVDSGGRLRSIVTGAGVPSGISLAGINVSGRYVFIRLGSAFGYIKGVVSAIIPPSSVLSPQPSVRVSVDRTPFVDVSSAEGRYIVIGAVPGANSLDALSLTGDATGGASTTLASQDSVADVSITVASVPLAVSSISPADSSTSVVVNSPVTVTFSKPVSPASLTGSSFKLTTASGNPVLGAITLLAGNRVASFTPASNLAGSTSYRVTLTTAVLDIYGNALASQFTSTFATAAIVTADSRLKPERIRVSYPNTSGFVTVSIPAGAVPVGSVIIVINNTSGSTVTTVASSTDISLQILAQLGDEIVVIVRQPDNVEYQVSQSAYRRDDGFTTVGFNGGAVTSDDGQTSLSIPKGAIRGQANIKLTPKDEASITIPRAAGSEMDPANVKFGAGVEIKAEGSFTVEKDLHLELPAPPDAENGKRICFMRPVTIKDESGNDIDVWEVITSGRVDGGKLKTSSPPFSGFLGWFSFGMTMPVYSFVPSRMRALYGRVTEPASAADPTPKPVAGVRCYVSGSAIQGGITANSAADGFYSTANFTVPDPVSPTVTAFDPPTNRRVSVGAVLQTQIEDSRFIQGLADLAGYRGDILLPLAGSGGGPSGSAPIMRLTGEITEGPDGQPPSVDTLQTQGIVKLGSKVRVTASTDRTIAVISGHYLISGTASTNLTWIEDPSKRGPNGEQTYTAELTVNSAGSYNVIVTGQTRANDPTTATEVRLGFLAVVDPNAGKGPIPGVPPAVISITPRDGASAVDVVTDIRIEFSEYVKNLRPGDTVYLNEDGSAEKIGGTVFSGGIVVQPDTNGIASIVFKPNRALTAGKKYFVNVTIGVVDTEGNQVDQDYRGAGDTDHKPFSSSFTTFAGLVLTPAPVLDKGTRIAVGLDYACTIQRNAANSYSLNVYDITDLQSPVKRSSVQLDQRPIDVAVSDETEYNVKSTVADHSREFTRIAVVTGYEPLLPNMPADLWIYNLDNLDSPELVGVASLYLPRDIPTAPLSVRIHNGRAYIGNAPYRGVIVVDIAQAVKQYLDEPDPLTPRTRALQVFGFAWEASKQAVFFGAQVTDPSTANGVDLLEQDVPAGASNAFKPHGGMPVAFVANQAAKQLVALGFTTLNEGLTGMVDASGDARDDRILSATAVTPSDSAPIAVRTIHDIQVQEGVNLVRRDLAVMVGGGRLWIFDVSNPLQPRQYTSRSFVDMEFLAARARSKWTARLLTFRSTTG